MFQIKQLLVPLMNPRVFHRNFVGFNEPPLLIPEVREVGNGISLEELNIECCKDWQNPDQYTDKRVQETYAYLLNIGKQMDSINEKLDRVLEKIE